MTMNLKMSMKNNLLIASLALLAALACSFPVAAQDTLAARIQKVMDRPEFARANFGIEFYALDTGKIAYEHNAKKLFVQLPRQSFCRKERFSQNSAPTTAFTQKSIAPARSTRKANSKAILFSSRAAILISPTVSA